VCLHVTLDPKYTYLNGKVNGVHTGVDLAAGEYIVRVRANDSSVAGAGHSQCCWSNGFVKVTVNRQP